MEEVVREIEEVFNIYKDYNNIRERLDPVIGRLVGKPRTKDITWVLLYSIIFEGEPGVRSITTSDLGLKAKQFDELINLIKERNLDKKIKEWYTY